MSRRLVLALDRQCALAGLPTPLPEVRFHPARRWRFDWAWPDHLLAVEIDGGLYVQGRHSRGGGVERDMEKYAAALLAGWRVLRVSPRHLANGQALAWIGGLLRVARAA